MQHSVCDPPTEGIASVQKQYSITTCIKWTLDFGLNKPREAVFYIHKFLIPLQVGVLHHRNLFPVSFMNDTGSKCAPHIGSVSHSTSTPAYAGAKISEIQLPTLGN